jgi:hypothetical protein
VTHEANGTQERFEFDVFGQRMRVVREQDRWRLYRLSDEGKLALVRDFSIPPELTVEELAGFLDDMYHEFATQDRPAVTRVETVDGVSNKQEDR